MASELDQIGEAFGIKDWRPHQLETFHQWLDLDMPHKRFCLYHRTGSGKTITALTMMALDGVQNVLVIAPPITHNRWVSEGEKIGLTVTPISHAKFRQKNYKVSRTEAIICDEFHLLGGHQGQGWKKFDRLAGLLQAPLILASATPNYNDVERVYCIQHALDPDSCRGGYLAFLYAHCITVQNPYSQTPLVERLRNFDTAAEYLDSLPYTHYLPDEFVLEPEDIDISMWMEDEWLVEWGLDYRRNRMIASQMEERHARTRRNYIDRAGELHHRIHLMLLDIIKDSKTPVLVFAASKEIAEAAYDSLFPVFPENIILLTGNSSTVIKQDKIELFRKGSVPVLIGTAAMATGTDGLDTMCDTLILLHDTDDDSLRKQIIGRITPRSEGVSIENKKVYRFTS